MRILSIESSGRRGSVAALEAAPSGELTLTRHIALSPRRRTAQTLAPVLRETLSFAGWSAHSVGLVAVTAGPGSFTGLRIGVTSAKTFAYATGAEILAVNTLEVLAAQTSLALAPLWTILDAQRAELFAAKFTADDESNWRVDLPTHIVGQGDWLRRLEPGEMISGPVLSRLADVLPRNVLPVDASRWQPRAETVGHIAWRDYQSGRRDDVWQLVPQYFRLSAAEEKCGKDEQ